MAIVAQPLLPPARGVPLRAVLAALGATVTVLHLLALDRLATWTQTEPTSARPVAWVTRTVRIEPPTPPATPAPAVAVAPRAAERPRAVVPRAATSPAAAASSAPMTPAPAPVEVNAPAEPLPAPRPRDAASEPTAPVRADTPPQSASNAATAVVGATENAIDIAASTAPTSASDSAAAATQAASSPGRAAREAAAAGAVAGSGQLLGPVAIPGSVRLRYDVAGSVRGREYEARGELTWLHDGSRYEARLEISALFLGARVQTSQGAIGPNGLEPTRFHDRARREQATHFERDKGRISFSGNSPPAPLLPLAQDRLSVFMQLAALLAGDPARYPVGAQIALPTAGPRESDLWTFRVLGEETVTVRGEGTRAVHLARLPQRDFEPRLDLWYAPSWSWMPVRIRLQQTNGDVIDQRLVASETP